MPQDSDPKPNETTSSKTDKPQKSDRSDKTKRSQSAVPQSFVGRAGRLAATSLKGSMRFAITAPRSLLGNKETAARLFSELHSKSAQDLVETLGRLKGASMKVGQLASFIDAGVLPPETRDMYQQTLASLRDAAPAMEPKLVKQVFVREFDAEPEDLFASFEVVPAAAASLGQVHHAVLHDGREVAVKVQYPGIASAIKSDLAMTAAVKPLMPLLAPGLDADDALEEIRARVLEECNYVSEAKNLNLLADHYQDHPFVWVPRSIPDRSTSKILTMERATGATFDEVKKMDRAKRDAFGEKLFRFYYGSLHRYGFTSADPHPGNYLLMDDGRVACYDFGLVCELTDDVREGLRKAFLALCERDVESFFEHGKALRYVSNPEKTSPIRFYNWVRFSLAPLVEDEEYTFTRAFIAERTAAMLDVRNEWWDFLRRLNLPRWAILQFRLELGLFAVLAQLDATGNWHRMTLEFYGERGPSTPLGEQEKEWLTASTL
ncbi:MAG: ABC1 kinase family protein [Actinomycetota bacterium]|nr:AarF/ABC1/UbiB kinase family protein [Actinomycetota bacterium]